MLYYLLRVATWLLVQLFTFTTCEFSTGYSYFIRILSVFIWNNG
nr:MAG TPA: hypothetical protein [Caudoviricetes sp.]